MRVERSVAVLALLSAFVVGAEAQVPTGSIVGTLVDQTGAVLPGAKVTLRDSQTGALRATTTSPVGYYEFLQLRPGPYDLTGEASGFRRLVERNIVVRVGQVVRLDLKMEVGEVTQAIEVTAEVPLVESSRVSIARVIEGNEIKTLPLEGRLFLNLALITPGSVPEAPGTQGAGFSVAGMRSQSNNYTLDGVNNNDPQINSPLNSFRIADAVQEFNVQTSIASTEVGRNPGAQISIITRSGGNNYHGTLFYYHRNDALDASDFFLNKAGQPKNPLRRHQFGGTVGGFLVRDKTFWFFNFEGWRQKIQQPTVATVPTPQQRAQVTDPVSRRLLQFWPAPNTPSATGRNNWTGTASSLNDNETYLWKVDQNLSNAHRLMGRYAWFRGRTLSQQTGPFNGLITNDPGQHSAVLAHTYATARLVNELRAGFSRNRTFFLPADVKLNPAEIFTDAQGSPLPGYIDTRVDPLNGGLPRITISGITGLGAGTNMPQGRATNTFEYMDNLTLTAPWDWSRHTLRFGGHVRREIANRMLNGNYRGSVPFTDWANFARGVPRSGTLRTGEGGTFRTWFRTMWSFYAQDTFMPRPNITINYGLRYEIPGATYEKYDRGSNFVPGVGMMALGSNRRIDIDPTKVGRDALSLTEVSTRLSRTGQLDEDFNNIAPFLGITWSPRVWKGLFGEGKTVVRTGFRLGYDDIFHNIPVNMGLNFPPILTTTLPTGSYTWGTALNQNRRFFATDATAPEGSRGIVSFNAWDYDAPTAYAMNYALEIERQFGRDYSLGISYVGSQGRKLGLYLDANAPDVIVNDPGRRGDQTPNARLFPFRQYAGIFVGSFGSNSHYNGMVATFKKRYTQGVSINASYTLGKAMDDNSSFFGSSADDGSYADPRNRLLDRGRSGFDVRQRVIVHYIWELPVGRTASGALKQLIGGWQVAGITTYRTGFPFTIHARHSVDWSGRNQFTDRPNWATGVSRLPINMQDPDNAYGCTVADCSAFVPPRGAGDPGNVSRNLFTGPSHIEWNFALLKNFSIKEGLRAQLRTEFFNLFNNTRFGLPNHNVDFNTSTGKPISSSSVGTITGADDPRLIQVGLRIEW